MDSFDLAGWEKRRSTTFIVFVLESVLIGMEYSVIVMTLLVYLKTLVKTDDWKMFYALAASAFAIPRIVFALIIARWVDKTRSVQLIFFICNNLVVAGNLTYVIHHSPWLPVAGLLLAGVGGSLRSVMCGEISRCFPTDQQTEKFSANGAAFVAGFIIGPGVNFFFKNIDIKISIFHITAANAPGMYMAMFFLLAQIPVLFLVHDLSKEYDLKASSLAQELAEDRRDCHTKTQNYNDNDKKAIDRSLLTSTILNSNSKTNSKINDTTDFEENNSGIMVILGDSHESDKPLLEPIEIPNSIKQAQMPSVSTILLQNIKNIDVTLIFFLSFGISFWVVSFEMWIPMMAIDVLHMSFTGLNLIFFGSGCASTVILALFVFKQFSDKAVFIWSLMCMFCLASMDIIFASMKLFSPESYVNITLWVIWNIFFAIVDIFEDVFMVGVLAKMTSPTIQTFNESLRLSVSCIGSLIAFLTAAMLFDYVVQMCVMGLVFSIFAFIALLLRRKNFQNPQLTIR